MKKLNEKVKAPFSKIGVLKDFQIRLHQLMKMVKKDKLLKAVLDDRVQDIADGRTCKWTRVTKGFIISKRKTT